MKKLLTILSLVMIMNFAASAQVVISEILYNIPGDGESEEFIELYNAGTTTVNLQGYSFTQGVAHTFNGGAIAAGGYFVVAADSAAYFAAFGGFPDAAWTSGGLSNGGEDIAIIDGFGVTVDSVNYDDAAPWSLLADGGGRSLQLCDAATDNNNGANWGTANIFAGLATSSTTMDSLFATPGMSNTCDAVIAPAPSSYPLYTIDDINNIDADGSADSVGVTCELRAVAYCNDNRASGYDFPFANSNNSNGVRVFSFNDVSNYTFTAGDSLHIFGTVSQFNGLLQFAPDSIVVATQGVAAPAAVVVTTLDESTENRYVMLNNVTLVDTAEWTGTGSGFNVSVTDGSTDTTIVRIDNDVDLYSMPAPTGTFNIAGWVTQFDATVPRDEGYTLAPCSATNITANKAIKNASSRVAVYPNPVSGVLNIESEDNIESIQIYNTLGQLVFNQSNVETTTTQIGTINLENGMYIIAIQTENAVMTQQVQVLR